jgi:glycosyltransferase involved in cell wall biosynthesis
MSTDPRTKLATIGGFTRPRDSIAHGTHHAAYISCEAIARFGPYREIHVYHDPAAGQGRQMELVLPKQPPARAFDKSELRLSPERYAAIYVANGEQIGTAPYVLRPEDDWAPVICSVGTTHSAAQWEGLLVALASDAVRPSDGFIFKSRAAHSLFRDVWNDWIERFGFSPAFPESSVVIANGVDTESNQRSDKLRDETRRKLRIRNEDVVFLAFSRLSPASKGDQLALIVRWKEVVERLPGALLVLAGAQVDRGFVMEQRQLARAAGVADRVLVVENPFELMANARGCLMSAADVFVHLTTGVEEASPLVISEAMAHALPVLGTAWAGLPEVISEGVEGFLIPTRAAPVPASLNSAAFGMSELPVGLAGSRAVTTGFEEFVDKAVALGAPGLRQTMAAAARRNALARTHETAARAYIDHFQRASQAALRDWPTQRRFRPLVTMDRVLGAQTSGRLQPADRVRLGRADNADLLREGMLPESAAEIAAALAAFAPADDVSLGQVATAICGARTGDGDRGPASAEAALRSASRLLARLLNFGVIRRI